MHGTLSGLMRTLLSALLNTLRAAFLSRASLALESAALRQQLTIYQRAHGRPQLRKQDRAFWVILRRLWCGWDRALIVVKPETVIAWHRQASGCSGTVARAVARSAGPAFTAATSPASGGSRVIIRSGERTRSARRLPPSSASSTPPPPSAANGDSPGATPWQADPLSLPKTPSALPALRLRHSKYRMK